MNDKIAQIIATNSAVQLLAQLHGGLTITELAEAQRAAVEAVRKTGKKCVIKIEITISPDGKGEVVSVETTGKVEVKLPRKTVRPTTFFVTQDNELQRSDPNQPELTFEAPGQAKAAGQN